MNTQFITSDLAGPQGSSRSVFDERKHSEPLGSIMTPSDTPTTVVLVPAVGSTVAATMDKRMRGINTSRSVVKIMKTVEQSVKRRSSHVKMLIQALLYTIVARRNGNLFSDKSYGRLCRSLVKSYDNLAAREDQKNSEVKYLKYHLALLFAKACEDSKEPEYPPLPSPDFAEPLFVGFIRNMIVRARARKDFTFLYSFLMSKRAWPRLTKESEQAALADHKEYICGRKTEKPTYEILSMISKVSARVFQHLPPPQKLMPTGSACIQKTKLEGGTSSLFQSMMKPSLDSKLGKLRDWSLQTNQWRQSTFDAARKEVERTQFRRNLLRVEVQAIPEPGKFRIITKGDGYLYTALQPAQGQLLSAWKKHPSSTMTIDIDAKVDLVYKNTPSSWFWMSVDYRSATDLIFKQASNAALMPLNDLFESRLAWLSMMNAGVVYPDGEILNQTGGQLMGHPLSFPLLCVINLACLHEACRRYVNDSKSRLQRKQRKDSADLILRNNLINGDDMLFRSPADFRSYFWTVTAESGLQVSIGKSYMSRRVALINSRLYLLRSGGMYRSGYLNLKLCLGNSLKAGESAATPDQIGKDLGEMIRLVPWTAGMLPRAFESWSRKWKGRFQPNWYLPVHLGGYGVPSEFAPTTWKVTRQQRIMAAAFVSDSKMQLYRRKGFSLETAQFAGALANFELVPTSGLGENPYENRLVGVTDEWLQRCAYISRALDLTQEKTSDKIFLLKCMKSYRFKPMSRDGLIRWWNAALIAYGVPSCPPMNDIRGVMVPFKERGFRTRVY
jgi:hypothetical protein